MHVALFLHRIKECIAPPPKPRRYEPSLTLSDDSIEEMFDTSPPERSSKRNEKRKQQQTKGNPRTRTLSIVDALNVTMRLPRRNQKKTPPTYSPSVTMSSRF
ncbi:unnamed protein product [Aphanomyces euteiches]|uniref:Uncharacterized protein n=1 Tax=Aphanomyces euteiches TaxID=100861 RepID=A0A6G0XD13_9STRA|nr:hypothetical protein Ae201684_005934 [Aphanomyces euteiches]KAH9069027.1 hypothetical protein Ae201684P_004724 [Aphanomyces euteiches]KAH9141504.1 hypothetical protein AeRB84_014323 [Aphanomyces euteiches]